MKININSNSSKRSFIHKYNPIQYFKNLQLQMPKQRLRQASSTNFVGRKKHNLEHYFDSNPAELLTPNQRSIPKKKGLFKNKSKGKSFKKDQPNSRKNSNQKRQRKIDFSPPHKNLKKSTHKYSRLEQSNQREYDSPSRDQEQMDLILGGKHTKKQKGNSYVDEAIERVNENLKKNEVNEAVRTLNTALKQHPNNFDLNYLLGICYLISSEFERAINVFQNLLKTQPRKNIYLLLSVCYKKIDNYEQTQKILDECLQKYPKYYEAYIYRGKLYLKTKNYKKALTDFDRAIGLDGQKQIGLIGKGDCLRLMEKYDEAKGYYTRALQQKTNNLSILLRRAICNVELKRYDTALQDISKLLESDPNNSQALYFKGLILNKQKKSNQALICYQQAIKNNTNKKAVTRALYEITKITIQNRDYYQALYTLERAQFLDIDEKVIKKFKIFIDGVTSMMKKNYAQGIKLLTELANDADKPMSNFLKPLFYSSRSYGYMSLEKYPLAKEDLDTMERQFSLDLPNLYNKFICQGILSCNAMKYQQALGYFSKAGKAQPHRIQPNFYKAVTLICFANKLLPKDMKQKKMQYLESAMKTLSKVTLPIENNPSLFLVRGFLNYALNRLNEALEDLGSYQNQSGKNPPLVLYLSGLIYGQAGKYDQAIVQFEKAIKQDQKHTLPQIYLSKAKCNVLMGQIQNGFQDLQAYVSHNSSSPDIHIWAGHLLFQISAYKDASKAYSNISNITKNPEALLYKAMSLLSQKDIVQTVSNLKMILDLKYVNEVYFDYEMLEALRECSDDMFNEFGRVLKRVKQAKQKVVGLKHENFGNFFTICDYQFFKGVLYFYDGKYEQASKNFKRALELMEKRVENEGQNQPELLEFYKNSFNNLAFNYFEIKYNIAMAEIMLGNLAKASRFLKEISKVAEEQNQIELKNSMDLLINLLSKETLKKFEQKNRIEQNDEDQAVFYPFKSKDRLCSIFPEFVMPFSTPVRTRIYFCIPYVKKPDINIKFDFKILEHFEMNIIEIKPQAPWIRRSEEGVIFTDEVVKYDIELSESSESSSQEQQENEEQGSQMYLDEEQAIEHHENSARGGYKKNGFYEDDNNEESNEQSQRMQFNPKKLKEMLQLDPATRERLNKLR